MAPLKFGDFLKSAEDLLNNDFCFDRKFKVKTKTQNGFVLTSEGAMSANTNAVNGKLTSSFALSNGIVINKLGVGHDGRFFADASYNDVVEGLSLSTVVEDGGKKAPVGELGLTYKHDLFTATTKIDAMTGPTVKESLSANYEKVLVGGEIKYNTGLDKKAGGVLEDYNVGIAYKEADFTVSATSIKKLSAFKVAVHHNVNKNIEVGAVYEHGDKKNLSFGGIYKLDAFTTFQGKVDSNGILSVNAHQNVSPNLKVIASTEVNTANLAADSHRFGLQMLLS